jgi:putative FmdB family regulatory protein
VPIYEYKCNKCGHRFDIMQKVNDPPITTCPKCSGLTSKVISPSGLMFKGSGWYVTDYSSKGKNSVEAKPEKDQGTEKKEDKKEDKKEVKPIT